MNLVTFTEYLVKNIAKKPDMIKVSSFESDEDVIMLEIIVDPEDKSAIIGKNGKTSTAIRTLIAYKAGTTTSAGYWLASRHYRYRGSSFWSYHMRFVNTSGNVSDYSSYSYNGGFGSDNNSMPVRPIVTLKSDIQATGSGTSSDPWVLQ